MDFHRTHMVPNLTNSSTNHLQQVFLRTLFTNRTNCNINRTKCKPNRTKCKPNRTKCKPNRTKCKTNRTKYKINRTKCIIYRNVLTTYLPHIHMHSIPWGRSGRLQSESPCKQCLEMYERVHGHEARIPRRLPALQDQLVQTRRRSSSRQLLLRCPPPGSSGSSKAGAKAQSAKCS
jgi:hypothetical protein